MVTCSGLQLRKDSVQVCDVNGAKVGEMDNMTEPLISRANNDTIMDQMNDDICLNDFVANNSILIFSFYHFR